MKIPPNTISSRMFFFLASALIIFANACGAATYYVDFEAGSDGNNGAAPAAAFKHCPGDPEAKGGAASVKLQPGDMVIFKGGVAYLP